MTSEKQIQANQRNARKSTGPKTSEGKAAARYNATKHGLRAEEVLIPGEDEAHLADLGERLRDELQPVGELENMLVGRIIAAYWRLRRVGLVEASIFAWERYRELAERTRKEARSYRKDHLHEDLLEYMDIEEPSVVTDKEKLREVISRGRELEEKRGGETTMLGRAFVRDADEANAFSKLSRYETTLERSLYKALHELQRLQAARRAEGNVAPPVAVDVEVSGIPGEGL